MEHGREQYGGLELSRELRIKEELEGGTESFGLLKSSVDFQRPLTTLAKITVEARSNLTPVDGAMTR